MRKRWIIKEPDLARQKRLAEDLDIPPIIAQLLINRNITHPKEAEAFLNADLSFLHNPLLLEGMKKTAARIHKALARGEKILIYGDYDVDGITSAALLSRVLKAMGGNVIEYIPDRLEEGYGLNLGAAQFAYRQKVDLVVTVDCGISAQKEVEYLASRRIDTIIIDHHEPCGNFLPKAYSIVDPFQEGCTYPFKHLAGVGLVFKVVQTLLNKSAEELREHLDLVALGTVSDVVPQLGENRILIKHGLNALFHTNKAGIRELIHASGLRGKDITSGHIGYILGPRINASGRVGSPELALRLLTTENLAEAKELAEVLNRENRNRQRIQNEVYEEALDKTAREVNFKEHRVIVLSSEGWHPGVIGIVASRLAEKFYRPTVMISVNRNRGRGSARSIENFHLFEAISKCRDYLDSFGGHEGACGLTILPKFIDGFRDHINDLASRILSPADLLPVLKADMEIPLDKLSSGLIEEIHRLAPFGSGNPEPLFISENVTVKHGPRPIGKNGFKMWVTDGKITCEVLIFGQSDLSGISEKSVVGLAYTPSMNEWGGVCSIQLRLEDIRCVT